MKRFTLIALFLVLLIGCSPIREQAQLIGFKGNKSILVIDERNNEDTIIYGQRNKGKVGERYWVYWQSKNKISKIKKLQPCNKSLSKHQ